MTAIDAPVCASPPLRKPLFRVASEDGEMIDLSLHELAQEDLRRLRPVRFPSSYKGRPNKIGYYWSSTSKGSVLFESGLELRALIAWDFDPRVVGISTQPFYFLDSHNKRGTPPTPDALLVFANGDVAIREVKPAGKIDDQFREKIEAGRNAVRPQGWTWDIELELPTTLSKNVRWLSGYRADLWDPGEYRRRLTESASEPVELDTLLTNVGGGPIAMAWAMRLLWLHELVADLSRSLLNLKSLVAKPNHRDASGTLRYVAGGINLGDIGSTKGEATEALLKSSSHLTELKASKR